MLDGIGVPGLCGVCCHAEAWYFEEVGVDAPVHVHTDNVPGSNALGKVLRCMHSICSHTAETQPRCLHCELKNLLPVYLFSS
jgi:hypothetical protein